MRFVVLGEKWFETFAPYTSVEKSKTFLKIQKMKIWKKTKNKERIMQ